MESSKSQNQILDNAALVLLLPKDPLKADVPRTPQDIPVRSFPPPNIYPLNIPPKHPQKPPPETIRQIIPRGKPELSHKPIPQNPPSEPSSQSFSLGNSPSRRPYQEATRGLLLELLIGSPQESLQRLWIHQFWNFESGNSGNSAFGDFTLIDCHTIAQEWRQPTLEFSMHNLVCPETNEISEEVRGGQEVPNT